MDLRASLSRLDAQSFLVLGDCFVDEYITGNCSRLSPEAPVPILRVDPSKTRRVLGGAANTAANITALGGQVRLFALYARDDSGKVFESLCTGAGIQLQPFHDGRSTLMKTRLLGQRQQLLRLDYEETHDIDIALEKEILTIFRLHLPTASGVILSDYAKGSLTASLTVRLIEEAHLAGKPVIVDPRPQHASRYPGCDFLTPNWKESLGLLGLEECEATPSRISEVGQALRGKMRAHILLTLGPQGMAFFDRDSGEFFQRPTAAREVYDVSGAGDTVVATFALAHAAGFSHREAVEIANQAAGLVVAKLGTATVTQAELLAKEHGDARRLERNQLAPICSMLRAQSKRIVTVNGSFDLLHAGHLHILEEARKQGDVLIVGLNSDASVKRYKSADRPIIPEAERAAMLLALRCVDYVHVFDEEVPMPFLTEVKPDIHVNGSEYGADCIEAPLIRQYGGSLYVVEKIPGLSSSGILERIRSQKGL